MSNYCKNCYELTEKLEDKEQECERLKKCLLQVQDTSISLDKQLDQLKAENERLKRNITEIFACLIKANRSGIITDTIWVGTIMTLWDYMALTLGIEGDQVQVEEQVLQKISEVEND